MDATRYFFQQLSGRFFGIVFLSFFLFSALTTLLVLRDNQVTSLAEHELPLLANKNKQQQQILTTYLALENLAKRTDAENLSADYEQAQQQINNISLLVKNNKAQLDLMYVGHKEFSGIIDKLSENHHRNTQLKQSTLIQLQLINDQLTVEIKEKQRQKNLLLEQINSDKYTDKVTATRAKAYVRQITELSSLQQLQQTIIRALLAFQQLNLQSSIIDFDDVSTELKQVLTTFLPEESTVSQQGSLLTLQLNTLEQLLFSQQNAVAKWRSHLRLSRLYVEFIEQQQQKLQQLVLESIPLESLSADKKLLLIAWVPANIKDFLAKQNVSVNNQNLQLALLAFILLLFLLLLAMIVKTKRKIKEYGQESVHLFRQFIESSAKNSDEKLRPEFLNSRENREIAEQLKTALETMINPEHSEQEYQQQLAEQQITNGNVEQQNEEIKKLKNSLQQLALTDNEQALQRQLQASENNNKLTNMVVRSMLQSQSLSIGAGVTSVQVYRQLTRIFDWCRQHKMRSEFLSAVKPMTLSDVALHNEIDAALLNIIADAHLQRNKIYYQQDPQLLTAAKVDVRLFHRLLNGICRLLLVDLFKANLHIGVGVIDKNEGQQIVRFDFSVTSKKAIAKLPEEVERLLLIDCAESAKIHANDTLDYLSLLLDSLNVTDKNVQLQEKGYQFSFTLPIGFADAAQDISVKRIDLKQTNILLLSSDNNICNITEKAVTSANGIIATLANPELMIKQLSTAQLTDERIDIVILGSDFYLKSLEKIQQHISSLAKDIQPKLFVMQPYFNSHLARHGLFEQTENPLQIIALQQSLADFITTEKTTNSQLSSSMFNKHQYLVSQVEVLFAVENPSRHLTLLRILRWLGLQVKVVCQPKAMTKLWSSGRYLLLFTEFEQSPFIQMSAGKGVRRDIFTFNKSTFSNDDTPRLAEKWRVSIIPALHDIDALVILLQPWLKAKPTKVVAINKVKAQSNQTKAYNNIDAELLNTTEKLDKVLSTLDLTPAAKKDITEPFNLEHYAKNQGSAELAMLMLDDYLADIDDAMKKLSTALAVHNYPLAISLTNSLFKPSKILAAENFIDISQQLLFELKPNTTIEHLQVMALFSQLSEQQQRLNEFAEAI
ncbi:hypothetical protein [Colwellia hornerae]|uniref:Uncharacterized protein n=1 Tax=Colwellia hornerae TaxID=89402 RepID=A0A5C6QHQ7_9GAMM|nr:hypothetical protein [Colwellia hornerae]TWX52455.1 hypothetical protein ESZ28_12390 [Colwellia hornerae]TWX58284.1 hypothetical protein ESZ26_12355 [Colwellia hornerae]TWX68371.1 hypothetical protein ESZ27_07100 [Colwellia hornerae]